MYFKKHRKIYIVAGITDMRKQINGLASLAQARKPSRVFSGSYFVFLGKRRNVKKILYWDRTGFCLWQKRREQDTFPWTKKKEGGIVLPRERFRLLLRGSDIFRVHTTRHYVSV